MTHSRSLQLCLYPQPLQTSAYAQGENIPLLKNSAQTADANTAHSASMTSHSSELLSTLLELAYEVLGIRCNSSDNFFDHGDSMAAAQLCALGSSRYGWTITPRDVFGWQSFALLAGVIERDETERLGAAATQERQWIS